MTQKTNHEDYDMILIEKLIERLKEALGERREAEGIYESVIDEIVRLDTECLNQEIIIGQLRKEIETLKAYANHERDLGAEEVAKKDTEVIQSLIEALKDAQYLIDNDLVGPWMSKHNLDELLK